MLQQTTVAAVTPRFERFVERWPTVEALAAATDEDILAEWAGPRLLCAGAKPHRLRPRSGARAAASREPPPSLRTLPGIGAYTAAAIAAIAFGERAAAVDTNVARVIVPRFTGSNDPQRGRDRRACPER